MQMKGKLYVQEFKECPTYTKDLLMKGKLYVQEFKECPTYTKDLLE